MAMTARAKRLAWSRAYHRRMELGLEPCRNCGRIRPEMTWGHLVPASQGGPFNARNITILCTECNQRQGISIWGWLIGLGDEENFAHIVEEWGERDIYPEAGESEVEGDMRDLRLPASSEQASSKTCRPNLDGVECA